MTTASGSLGDWPAAAASEGEKSLDAAYGGPPVGRDHVEPRMAPQKARVRAAVVSVSPPAAMACRIAASASPSCQSVWASATAQDVGGLRPRWGLLVLAESLLDDLRNVTELGCGRRSARTVRSSIWSSWSRNSAMRSATSGRDCGCLDRRVGDGRVHGCDVQPDRGLGPVGDATATARTDRAGAERRQRRPRTRHGPQRVEPRLQARPAPAEPARAPAADEARMRGGCGPGVELSLQRSQKQLNIRVVAGRGATSVIADADPIRSWAATPWRTRALPTAVREGTGDRSAS